VELVGDITERPSASSAASVRSILKAAISSAEQIVDTVKMKVVAEAEQEAVKIIAEAKEKAEKVRGVKTPVQEETTEDVIAVTEEVAEEQKETPVRAEEEAVAVKDEELTPLQEEAVAPVAEKEVPEKAGKQERKLEEREPRRILTEEESKSSYHGEVELTIEVPVEPTIVSGLYNYLQTTPEIKFIRTTGSWNKGSTITIVLDKPIPLVSALTAKLPEAYILPQESEKGGHAKDRGGVRKISISRKD
jgi:tRNA/tmRNA/rRNA uracil-C5-methylase (TrmA/RlmC/RlmD family)